MLEQAKKCEHESIYELMLESFPRDELRRYEEQLEIFALDAVKTYVCRDGGEVAAFFTVWELDGFSYIEHFAVSPSKRCSGSCLRCSRSRSVWRRSRRRQTLPDGG